MKNRTDSTTLHEVAAHPSEANGRRALVTGITGHDDGYLAEFLHDLRYHVGVSASADFRLTYALGPS